MKGMTSPRWINSPQRRLPGSAGLEQRLHESLNVLSKLGVRVPETGRHRAALRTLAKWNAAPDAIDLSNKALVTRLEATHRTAWETFVISVAAWERRRRRDTLFTREKLNLMMGGAEVHEGTLTLARDTQFELFIGAQFQLASAEVNGGEPDLRFRYGYEEVGIAAKRITSLKAGQVNRHVGKAVRQIGDSGLRGWIALNLDARFRTIDVRGDEAELIRQFGSAFDSVNGAIGKHSMNARLLGFMLFGYGTGWYPAVETGPPRLHVVSPVRWIGWSDDAGEKLLYQDYVSGWMARRQTRMDLLASPAFVGVL